MEQLGVLYLQRPQKVTNLSSDPLPPPPPSAKVNNRCVVSKQWNLQSRDKFQDPTPPIPLPYGHPECTVPYYRSMIKLIQIV